MSKQITKVFLIIIFCLSLLSGLALSAQAKILSASTIPTPTPTTVTGAPTPITVGLTDSNNVTFSQLKQAEIQLNGPYSSVTFLFAIPASWQVKSGAQLDLLFGVSFNTVSQSQTNAVFVSGGTITVLLNNQILTTIPLNQVGEIEQKIPISPSAFTSTRPDGRMTLRFVLNTGISCRIYGAHTVAFIHPTTYLTLPHDSIKPSTNLVNYPRPIFQNSFLTDSALMIVPDQPSPAEIQAALTVASSLGNLSQNALTLDMTTLRKFSADQASTTIAATNHLIFVGKASSMPLVGQFTLPLPIKNGQFQNPSGTQDDGVVEMVDSPWSGEHVVMVISGDTDQAVIKAAQAVSTGILRTNTSDNLAIVQQVNSTPVSNPQSVDQTLSDLGYQGRLFQNRGVDAENFTFNVPAGMMVTPDAYFDMVFGHTSLIDYNSSQIVVLLNDHPIGSVRMSDATAAIPANHIKIMIPPSAVIPGSNRLAVNVNIVPLDDCTPPNVQGLWINIWPQSTLHLPLTTATNAPVGPQNLSVYPVPFIYNPQLQSTAFILENNELDTWRNALKIASYLGSQVNGGITELSVFFGNSIPETERSKYNFVMIGRPSQMPIVNEINNQLPAPFSLGNDIATEKGLQVQYRIPPDSPLGYVETLLSPWNSSNVILAILGNTTQGVNWAAFSLINPPLRNLLGGNFAVVNNQQIITTSTNPAISSGESTTSTQAPAAAGGLVATAPASAVQTRPVWIIPVMVISLVLIVLILIVVAIRNWSRNRQRHHQKIE